MTHPKPCIIDESLSAANDKPGLPAGTTLFDLVAALQDAADEMLEDADAADMAVCASLVELRHQLRADIDQELQRVA